MTLTFLLSSRLGLLHQPQGQSELNVGVEDAPRTIVTPQLIEELQLQPLELRYTSPDQIVVSDYLHAFSRESTAFRDRIAAVLKASTERQPTSIAVGGDHSVSLAHIAALLQTVAPPTKTGIVMFDSHADMNLVKTSPTGNVHGMWLRPLISQFDEPEMDHVVAQKITPKNLVYVGNQDLDPAEREFIEQQGIKVFSVEYLRENKDAALAWFTKWLGQLQHLHLSIDVDGFDKSLTPATGIPCQKGLLIEDVTELISQVKQFKQWSADIVEVNPRKAGAEKTVQFSQDLLRRLLTEEW